MVPEPELVIAASKLVLYLYCYKNLLFSNCCVEIKIIHVEWSLNISGLAAVLVFTMLSIQATNS